MHSTSFMLVLISSVLKFSTSSNILLVFPVGSHSHYTLGIRLAIELVDRGHVVTFISPYPQKKPIKNLRDISLAGFKKQVEDMKKGLFDLGSMSFIGQLEWTTNYGLAYTENILKVNEIQELLHSDEHFDLVIIEHFLNEALAIFEYKFNCPSIVLSPGPVTLYNSHLFVNPYKSAYVPNIYSGLGTSMTLWERTRNLYYDIVGALYVHLVSIPGQNRLLQRTVPGAPNLQDILYNSSFMLTASHVSLYDPIPLQPNVKELGGYHIFPPKPLPKDIQEFLDGAKEGVILFSMGANLQSASMPQEKIDTILKVFSRMKQKVIWKFEADLPGKPENVKIWKWLPQQDVLEHPNVVAFVTHCGLLGKIEAIYHGVPMVGLPVYYDQVNNLKDGVRQGYLLGVPLFELTEEVFDWALNEIISNPKYRENAKMRSRIMHDQPVKQIDEAMFWIEYTIRHRGAPHYKSPALKLRWYQEMMLDVMLFVTGAASTIFAVIFYILKRMFGSRKVLRKGKTE